MNEAMSRRLLAIVAFMALTVSVSAQSLWLSGAFKTKVVGNLGVSAEMEYRSTDGIDGTDRWSWDAGVNYKVFKWLKFDAGYKYIHERNPGRITKKGNHIPAFWQPRHRIYAGVTGSYSWNRFTFSIRERYQYTHRKSHFVPKFDDDGVTPKKDEFIAGSDKHVLRSRIEIGYNIRKSRFSPYMSCEFYNLLDKGLANDKTRLTAGTSFRINKQNSLDVFYRYSIVSGSDDNLNIIGVGYTFKL